MKKLKKSKLRLNHEYCCDFETTSKEQYLIEGRTRVYLYKWTSLDGSKSKVGLSIKEFLEDLKNNKDIHKIYFHNLSFDGNFILYGLFENGYIYKEKIENENEFTSIIDNFGSIYKISIGFKDRIVDIQCSYKLTGLSIKDLGKLVGLEKLNETHDYNEIKNFNSIEELTQEELMYINNDVEIQRRGIIECYKMGLKGLTKSSACFSLWRNMNFKKIQGKIGVEYSEEVNHIVNNSYRGGITMINPLCANKLITDVRDYDVNSLYPSVMYNEMPIGQPLVFKNIEDIPKNYTQRLYLIYIIKAKIIKPYIPFIPTTKSFIFKDSYDYTDNLEMLEIALWEEEYQLFKTYYESEHKIIKIVAFKGESDLFTEYLDIFKEIKENAPNPSPQRTFAKLCMNSLYGKFAQNNYRVSNVPIYNGDIIEYDKKEDVTENKYSKAIASRITSYARCVLIKAINKDPTRFIYCDTDSIYIKGDYEYNIPVDNKKLGYWKYENSYYKFKGLKAKCYISTIKGGKDDGKMHSAISGLPKEVQNTITFDNFKNGLTINNAKKQIKRVKGGVIIDNIPFTIKVKENNVITNGGDL